MEVFLNCHLLVVIQDFTPTHRLARTCKSIKNARDEYKHKIQYTLTFAGTQKYIRKAEFRGQIGKLIPDPGTQLELRCQIDECSDDERASESGSARPSCSESGSDAEGSFASPGASGEHKPLAQEAFDKESGPLTRDIYINVLRHVRGFQICAYTRWSLDCLKFIDDWGKVTCFDGHILYNYDMFKWKLATNMARVVLLIPAREDLHILDFSPSVTYLRLEVGCLVAPDIPRTNFSKLERLIVAVEDEIDFKNFGVMPRLRTLVVGFELLSGGRHNVMPHIREICPNIVSLSVSYIPGADVSGIASLTELRTLSINNESIDSPPCLDKLTRLCVRDSQDLSFDESAYDSSSSSGRQACLEAYESRLKASTARIIRALCKKRSCLPSLEELTLECALVTDFTFLEAFPSLKSLQ